MKTKAISCSPPAPGKLKKISHGTPRHFLLNGLLVEQGDLFALLGGVGLPPASGLGAAADAAARAKTT